MIGTIPVEESTAVRAVESNIAEQIGQLSDEEASKAGRNARVLVHYPNFRVILTVMRANTSIHQHQAAGSLSIQTMSGRIRVRLNGSEFELPTGKMLALECAIPHEIEALEDSAFLLTIAWPEGQAN